MDVNLAKKFLMEVFNAPQEEPDVVESISIESLKQPPKITRTAMGERIVEPGEKPLTSLGIPAPGPADYSPDIKATRCEPPHFSVAGKTKTLKPKLSPGPANYYTGRDMKWSDKYISVKGRTQTSVFDNGAKTASSDIGSARYRVKENEVGRTGPKYSMAHRTVDTGIKSRLIQPPDVHGFNTPGPNYRPNSAYWGRGPKKSFGSLFIRPESEEPVPGPADYTIHKIEGGPAYSLAKRIPERKNKKSMPAPNTYDLGTTIGKAVAMSMTARREDLQAQKCAPSPNSYSLKSTLQEKTNSKTMAYRWFDRKVEHQPGPCDYEINQKVVKPRYPAYSCRRRTSVCYPDSQYCNVDTEKTPGPGNYPLVKDFNKNDNPAYSIGSRSHMWQDNDGPGPNKYHVEKYPKPGAAKAPQFSMRKRIERRDIVKEGPGPAAYHPELPNSGPSYTMNKRSTQMKIIRNPAPNAYNPPPHQTIKGLPTKIGTSLKSRASPWVYSGFKTNKLYDPTVIS